MAASSSFSYAQAAKGQGGSSIASQPAQSTTSQQDGGSEYNEDKANVAQDVSEISNSTQDTTQDTDSISPTLEKQELDTASTVESDTRTESVSERLTEHRRDDDTRRLDRPWRRNDKGTRSSSATTRSIDEPETRKPRKGRKGKSSDKHTRDSSVGAGDQESKAEDTPKIELLEAPIPSVNIWHQRKEAQLAKAKPTEVAHQDSQPASHAPKAIPSDGGSSTRETPPVTNGSKPYHKPQDNARPERHASRGSRVAGKDAKAGPPPSVEDATVWPTPEISIKEDKRKPSDKIDAQEDPNSAKPRQKKEWVTYDYVPTVNFETQLPQMRGSKPRGGAKGSSGSRTSTAGSQQPTEKTGVVAPTTKAAEPKERTREAPSQTNGAPAAVSPPAKRTPTDVPQARSEQKKQAPVAATDKPLKDGSPNRYTDQGTTPREGRAERGRGAYRGRGNHHGAHGHSQHQHTSSAAAPPFQPQASLGSRSQGPYSPPLRQGQGAHGQVYMPPNQRGGRGGRNGSSNYHRMSLPNGSARLPPVETQFSPYGYQVPSMSAVPFQQAPYWDPMMLAMVRNQVEYYFSIENLCKDMYLRRRMDSQGFVSLLFIAGFKRMRELTTDLALVRHVCEETNEIEYVVGDDDQERLRRRNGWQNFVLPMKERDDIAQTPGPAQFSFKSRSFAYAPHYNGMAPQGFTSPPGYQPQPFMEEHHNFNGAHGLVNGNGHAHGGASQLSAEVPDFSPSHNADIHGGFQNHVEGVNGGQPLAPFVNGLPNGVHTQ